MSRPSEAIPAGALLARTRARPLRLLRTCLLGAGCTLAIFVVLTFTQILSRWDTSPRKLTTFDVAPPPPPPPPEIEEPPEPERQEEPPPRMTEPPPPMSLSQLELALNPGFGDALSGALGFGGFDVQADAVADMRLFDVEDLDEPPRALQQVKMDVPMRFRRERVSGMVRLEVMIDERGATTVLGVVESSHAELEEAARTAASQWRWSPPRKNGEVVRARYILPIGFRF